MANPPDNFDPLYAPQTPSTSVKTYRNILDVLDQMRGQYIELYIGETYENIEYEEVSRPQISTIFGKVIECLDRFLVLDCFYVDQRTQEVKDKHIVFINAFQIRTFTSVDGGGSLDDIFLSAKHVNKIKKIIKLKQTK